MTPAADPDNASPNAVVTGAAGWLGQNLVRSVAPQRCRVRCLVQDPQEAPLLEIVGPSVEVVSHSAVMNEPSFVDVSSRRS